MSFITHSHLTQTESESVAAGMELSFSLIKMQVMELNLTEFRQIRL